MLKRRIKNAARALQGKPSRSIQLGVDVRRCDKCKALRPCEVDGKICIFHRFIDEDKALLEIEPLVKQETLIAWRRAFNEFGEVPPHSTVKIMRHTYALVEYSDGSVGKVEPELVQFLDREEA